MAIRVQLNAEGLVKNIEHIQSPDWIESYKTANADKLPILSDALLPIVNNYKGDISKAEVIPISGQQWHNLTQTEKNQLLELVEYLGGSAEEYTKQWQSMLPRTPRGK